MNADIKGCLVAIDKSYRVFEHNGKPMSKHQVKAVLEYGLRMGYKTTKELSDEEIQQVLDAL